jgi:hypothetical protein
MSKTLFAFTPSSPPEGYVPYLNVREQDGCVIITVRGNTVTPQGAETQGPASIDLPLLELVKFVACVAEYTSAKLRELPEDDAKMLLLQAKADLA